MPKTLILMLLGNLLVVSVVAIAPWNDAAGQPEAAPAPAPEKNWFVGVTACKDCHKKNWASWRKKPGHKNAFKILKLPARKNPKCLKCHVTGYGHPSGTGFVSKEKSPQHAGVGCEGCHGPGGLHVKLMEPKPDVSKMKDFKIPAPDKESCVYCHKFHRHF